MDDVIYIVPYIQICGIEVRKTSCDCIGSSDLEKMGAQELGFVVHFGLRSQEPKESLLWTYADSHTRSAYSSDSDICRFSP